MSDIDPERRKQIDAAIAEMEAAARRMSDKDEYMQVVGRISAKYQLGYEVGSSLGESCWATRNKT
jgi:hypothetical protein